MSSLSSAQIDDSVASLVIAQLLFLQSESNNKPIHMYINSPGKSISTDTGGFTADVWCLNFTFLSWTCALQKKMWSSGRLHKNIQKMRQIIETVNIDFFF